MENKVKWSITNNQKEKFIKALTPELPLLRTKVGISQGELANLIGISRQTYGDIERGKKSLSWNIFLALMMFYDYNHKTHKFIRTIGAFPNEMVRHFNNNLNMENFQLDSILGENFKFIQEHLDEEAMRAIRTVVMIEYARCTDTPGDVIIKSFDGNNFNTIWEQGSIAAKSLKSKK